MSSLDSDMHSPHKHTIHVKDKISKLVFFTQKNINIKLSNIDGFFPKKKALMDFVTHKQSSYIGSSYTN